MLNTSFSSIFKIVRFDQPRMVSIKYSITYDQMPLLLKFAVKFKLSLERSLV